MNSALPAGAAVTRTYSINAASAFNYQITGTVIVDDGVVSDWYHADWKYRQKIVISSEQVKGTLTDFPVLIRLDGVSLDGAREDQYDLLFTAADGQTKLAHERESASEVWVKVPEVSASDDTVLYMYYGNPAASDQQQVQEVWSNGFVFVYHMNRDPAVTTTDSAGSGVHFQGTSPMNASDSLREGIIGNATYFKHTSGPTYLDLGQPAVLNIRDKLTLSAWINTEDATQNDNQQIISVYDGVSSSDETFYFSLRAADVRYSLRNAAGTAWSTAVAPIRNARASQTTESNVWYHALGTFDGSTMRAFVNGVGGNTATKTDQIRSLTRDMHIGDRNEFYSSAIDFQGRIDEVRIANVGRSAEWVSAEYTNQCNCENFLTISDTVETSPTSTSGTEQATIQLKPDRPLSFTTLTSFVPNGSTQITYQLSNDGGKTWLFYGLSTSPQATAGWKSANPTNPDHRSSARDIHSHLTTFPKGDGKLLWKAYLPAGTSLDSIQIGYEPGVPLPASSTATSALPATSLSDARIQAINTLFAAAYGKAISPTAWTYWVTRMLSEGKHLDGWLGAMQWQAVFGT